MPFLIMFSKIPFPYSSGLLWGKITWILLYIHTYTHAHIYVFCLSLMRKFHNILFATISCHPLNKYLLNKFWSPYVKYAKYLNEVLMLNDPLNMIKSDHVTLPIKTLQWLSILLASLKEECTRRKGLSKV